MQNAIYKIQNQKNGNNGLRGASFASRMANTYIITNAGKYAGEIVQTKDARFNFKTNCWIVCLPGSSIDGQTFQYFAHAKAAISKA